MLLDSNIIIYMVSGNPSKKTCANSGERCSEIISYQVWLNSCHCDRREAIATISEMIEIASLHCVPFVMTDYNRSNGLDITG